MGDTLPRRTSMMGIAVVLAFLMGTADEKVGKKLPDFEVESADEKKLARKDLKGRITIITYETREVVEKNRKAKKALRKLCKEKLSKGDYRVIPIIDTSEATFFTRWVWRDKLRENSKKESLTIYGDWDGSAAKALGVKRNESNLIIVDAKGIIRYFGRGKFDAKEIERQKKVILSLRPAEAPKDRAP